MRDLGRRTAEVLEAATELGGVTILSRGGRRYVLKPEPREAAALPSDLPDFRKRWEHLSALGFEPPSPDLKEQLDRLIAGEE